MSSVSYTHLDVYKRQDLVVPVIILIIFCVTGLLYTGGMFEGGISVIDAFSNCDAPTGLMYGSFLALVLIFAFYMIRRTMTFSQLSLIHI